MTCCVFFLLFYFFNFLWWYVRCWHWSSRPVLFTGWNGVSLLKILFHNCSKISNRAELTCRLSSFDPKGPLTSSGRLWSMSSCFVSIASCCCAAGVGPFPLLGAERLGPPARPGWGSDIGNVGGRAPPGSCCACICCRILGKSRCCWMDKIRIYFVWECCDYLRLSQHLIPTSWSV